MLPSDIESVREKANSASLHIPTTGLDFDLLFNPVLFDPYYACRASYLAAAEFYKYGAGGPEQVAILDIARQRMAKSDNRPGYAPPIDLPRH